MIIGRQTIGCTLLLAPFAVWAVIRLLGLERGFPLVQLFAFTPYVATASLLPVLVAVATRQWLVGGAALLVMLALTACVLPRWFSSGQPAVAGAASGAANGAASGAASGANRVSLRVMTSNLLFGEADAPALVALVRDHDVDVLAVQEFTPEAERRLDQAGLRSVLPFRESHPEPGATGSGLYSRFPLRDGGVRANRGGMNQAYATVTAPGAPPVLVESAHPMAPYAAEVTSAWAADLADQPRATVDGPVRILAGDFNATLDHARLRQLIETGYRDAASTLGRGLTPTWPYAGRRTWITPKVTLDHVLADPRIDVTDFAAFHLAGTDHRPVLAQLVLPAAS